MINFTELYRQEFQINPIPNPNRKYKTYWTHKNSDLYIDLVKPLSITEDQLFSIGDENYVLNIDFNLFQSNHELMGKFVNKYKPTLIIGKYTNGNKNCMISHLAEFTLNEFRFVSNIFSCVNTGNLNNNFIGFLFLLDK
jgi:hypothetical protein